MDPLTLALLGGGINIVGSLIGQALGAGDRAEAERIRAKAAELFGDDNVNRIIQESNLGPSQMGQVQADPQAVAAQRLALQRMQEDSTTVGLTAPERAEYAAATDDAAQYERGQREAILQNAQARGVGGSGLELAALLQGQQGGAMRAHRAGLDAAAQAARRRALANMQMGQFGGQLRGQGFGEDSDKAQAADAIARFNAANTRDLKTMQLQGQYSNAMEQAAAKDGNARQTSQTWGGVGEGVGDAFATAADYEFRKKYGGRNG